jgi:hypothetical protein
MENFSKPQYSEIMDGSRRVGRALEERDGGLIPLCCFLDVDFGM